MSRFQFKFWLDCNKDDELLLAEEIDTLKQGRSFTATIRDGLRLILDLRAGRLDVLFELFPWVQERLNAGKGGDVGELKDKISQLEKLLISHGSTQIMQPAGPKPLARPTTTKPAFDDEDDSDLLVVREAKGDGNSALNFLRSAFALQGQVYKPQ